MAKKRRTEMVAGELIENPGEDVAPQLVRSEPVFCAGLHKGVGHVGVLRVIGGQKIPEEGQEYQDQDDHQSG